MHRLEWEHLWARYERRWVLRDIHLGVEAGRLLYLVGPAGGGKSTMIRVGSGAILPEAGRVWLDGQPVRRARAGILDPDEKILGPLSLGRSMERRLARAGVRGRATERRIRAALRAFDLESLRDTRYRALSGSLRQRALLAIQWACPARVWFLDNPTALLEPAWREAWPILERTWREREGGAVIIASQHVEEAMQADQAAIVHDGRIAAFGPPARLCRVSGAEEIIVRTVDNAAAARALSFGMRLEAEQCRDGLRLRVRKADDSLPGVLQTLAGQVETVWIRKPTMQDAIAYHTSLPAPPELPTQPPR